MNYINTTESYIFEIRTASISSSCFEICTQNDLEKTASASLGWAYIRLPSDIQRNMTKIRDMIDLNDLGEDGKESHPHITVKYGLTTTDPEEVKNAVAKNRGGKVRMGKTSLFKNDDADVLKISVTSRALSSLWGSLSTLDNEDHFDKYVAHSTLAYLKPGTGDKYVGIDLIDGEEFEFDRFVFEDAQDIKTEIKLQGSTIKKKAQADNEFDFGLDDLGDFRISTNFVPEYARKHNQEDPVRGEVYHIIYSDGTPNAVGIFMGLNNDVLQFISIDHKSNFSVEKSKISKINKIRYDDIKPVNLDLLIGNVELIPYSRYSIEYTNKEDEKKFPRISTFKGINENGFVFRGIHPIRGTTDNFSITRAEISKISRVNPFNTSGPFYMIASFVRGNWRYIYKKDDSNNIYDFDNSCVFSTEQETETNIERCIASGHSAKALRCVPCVFIITTRSFPGASSVRYNNETYETPQQAIDFINNTDVLPHSHLKVVPISMDDNIKINQLYAFNTKNKLPTKTASSQSDVNNEDLNFGDFGDFDDFSISHVDFKPEHANNFSFGFKNEDLEIGQKYRISYVDSNFVAEGILEGITRDGDLQFINQNEPKFSTFIVKRYKISKLNIVPRSRRDVNLDLLIGDIELIPGGTYNLEYKKDGKNDNLPPVATFQSKDEMTDLLLFYYPVSSTQNWSFIIPKDGITNISRHLDEVEPYTGQNFSMYVPPDSNVDSADARETILRNSTNVYTIEMLFGDTDWEYIGNQGDENEADMVIFDSQAEAMEQTHEISREFRIPEENLRYVPCEFIIKFRETPNVSWQNSRILGGHRFSTIQMANDYLNHLDRNDVDYKIFPIRKEINENATPEPGTQESPRYMVEVLDDNDGWIHSNYVTNTSDVSYGSENEDEFLTFATFDLAEQEMNTLIQAGIDPVKLRVSPCEFIIKIKPLDSNVSWLRHNPMITHGARFFNNEEANTYIRGRDLTNAYPGLEFKVVPTALNNQRLSSNIKRIKTSQTDDPVDLGGFEDFNISDGENELQEYDIDYEDYDDEDDDDENPVYILEVFDDEETGWLEYHENEDEEAGEYNYYASEEEAEIERQAIIESDGFLPDHIRVSTQNHNRSS
jgi:2'-5' RNA ligase